MIVALSTCSEPPGCVECTICGRRIMFTQATACFTRSEPQAFACTRHLNKDQERLWFRGWCRYMARRQIVGVFASVVKDVVLLP